MTLLSRNPTKWILIGNSAVIVSIVRLVKTFQTVSSPDVTWNFYVLEIWSYVFLPSREFIEFIAWGLR